MGRALGLTCGAQLAGAALDLRPLEELRPLLTRVAGRVAGIPRGLGEAEAGRDAGAERFLPRRQPRRGRR
jgi:hypothetical protein